MAIANKKSFNSLLREYFSDVAGISSGSKSLNDSIRLGLEALGYSGSINNMLKQWSIEQGGSGTSINSALKNAYLDMQGEQGKSINTLSGEYFSNINWNTILIKFEDEDRKWSLID
jgi:hypothetical protein